MIAAINLSLGMCMDEVGNMLYIETMFDSKGEECIHQHCKVFVVQALDGSWLSVDATAFERVTLQ